MCYCSVTERKCPASPVTCFGGTVREQPATISSFFKNPMDQDSEYLLLNSIHELGKLRPEISQRDLSRAIHLSLGMTNTLLKRLSQKGFVLVQKISPRRVTYALTPDGMNELAGKTWRYLKRTMKTVVTYKEAIVTITRDAKERGYCTIGLLGKSDIDFVIEYAAGESKLPFMRFDSSSSIPLDSFVFVSENYTGAPLAVSEESVAHIYTLLAGQP